MVRKKFAASNNKWLFKRNVFDKFWLDDRLLNFSLDILTQLRHAGLDEIRINIGATDYNLDSLQRAVGLIPTITVEIPAISVEKERIKGLLGELQAADPKSSPDDWPGDCVQNLLPMIASEWKKSRSRKRQRASALL